MGDSILLHTMVHGHSLFLLGIHCCMRYAVLFFTVLLGCNHKSGSLSNSGLCKMKLLPGEETSW